MSAGIELEEKKDLDQMCRALNIEMKDKSSEINMGESNTQNVSKLLGSLCRRAALQITSDDRIKQYKKKPRRTPKKVETVEE